MTHHATIEVVRNGRTAILALNRPNLLNAINGELMREVTSAMAEFSRDDGIGCGERSPRCA